MPKDFEFVGPPNPFQPNQFIHPDIQPPTAGAQMMYGMEKSPYEEASVGGFGKNVFMNTDEVSQSYAAILNNPEILLQVVNQLLGDMYTAAVEPGKAFADPQQVLPGVSGMASEAYRGAKEFAGDPLKFTYENPVRVLEAGADILMGGAGLAKGVVRGAVKTTAKQAADRGLDFIESTFRRDWDFSNKFDLNLILATLDDRANLAIRGIEEAGGSKQQKRLIRKRQQELQMEVSTRYAGEDLETYALGREGYGPEAQRLFDAYGQTRETKSKLGLALKPGEAPIRLHAELGELLAEKANVKMTGEKWLKTFDGWAEGKIRGEDLWNSGMREFIESDLVTRPGRTYTGAELTRVYAEKAPGVTTIVLSGRSTRYANRGGIQDPRVHTPSDFYDQYKEKAFVEGRDPVDLHPELRPNPQEDYVEIIVGYDDLQLSRNKRMGTWGPDTELSEDLWQQFQGPAWQDTMAHAGLISSPKAHHTGPVIAFMRGRFILDDRGRKVFYIDNIQSDLHQYVSGDKNISYRPSQHDLVTTQRSLELAIRAQKKMRGDAKQIKDLETLHDLLVKHASGWAEPELRYQELIHPEKEAGLVKRVKKKLDLWGEPMPSMLTNLEGMNYDKWLGSLDPVVREIAEEAGFFKLFAPDAPFKHTWQDLFLKKAIAWGVQNGADAVAWAPGWVQHARWGNKKFFLDMYDSKMPKGAQKILRRFGAKLERRKVKMGVVEPRERALPTDPGYTISGYTQTGPQKKVLRDQEWLNRHSPADMDTGELEWKPLTKSEKAAGGRMMPLSRGMKIREGVETGRDIRMSAKRFLGRAEGSSGGGPPDKYAHFAYKSAKEAEDALMNEAWYIDLHQMSKARGAEKAKTIADWVRERGMSQYTVIPPAAAGAYLQSQFGNREEPY